MPLYEYSCPVHGRFDKLRLMNECFMNSNCPECGEISTRIMSHVSIKAIDKPRYQFGSGCEGKIISHQETGGLDIFIPSYGAMGQDEVDYIGMVAVEKEQERVKRNKRYSNKSEVQARIQAYTDLANSMPKGKRAKTIREAIKDTGDRLIRR